MEYKKSSFSFRILAKMCLLINLFIYLLYIYLLMCNKFGLLIVTELDKYRNKFGINRNKFGLLIKYKNNASIIEVRNNIAIFADGNGIVGSSYPMKRFPRFTFPFPFL